MKRTTALWQLVGFAVTSLGGTLLHFLFDLTNGSTWVAPFSGVNESTFEHMKLLFWPMLLFALVQSLFFKGYASFFWVKLRGILLGLVLIPVLFYTYNGAIGPSPDWLNIAIFFVSAAIAYTAEARWLTNDDGRGASPIVPLALLGTLAVLFTVFTFAPPSLGLFRDPLTGTFGLG